MRGRFGSRTTLQKFAPIAAAAAVVDGAAGGVVGYVFVAWGDSFRAQHAEAYPEMKTSAVSVGLGGLGLQYILESGGSGYFPLRVVQPLIDRGRLYRVRDAHTMQRPYYVVYTADPKDQRVLHQGLRELRAISTETASP